METTTTEAQDLKVGQIVAIDNYGETYNETVIEVQTDNDGHTLVGLRLVSDYTDAWTLAEHTSHTAVPNDTEFQVVNTDQGHG